MNMSIKKEDFEAIIENYYMKCLGVSASVRLGFSHNIGSRGGAVLVASQISLGERLFDVEEELSSENIIDILNESLTENNMVVEDININTYEVCSSPYGGEKYVGNVDITFNRKNNLVRKLEK